MQVKPIEVSKTEHVIGVAVIAVTAFAILAMAIVDLKADLQKANESPASQNCVDSNISRLQALNARLAIKSDRLWHVQAKSTDLKYTTNNTHEDLCQALTMATLNMDTYNTFSDKDQME